MSRLHAESFARTSVSPHQNYYAPKSELGASFLRTPKKKIKSIDGIFLFFIFYCNYSKIRFAFLNLLI